MISTSSLSLEWRKYNARRIAAIVAVTVLLPFLFTLFITFTQANGIRTLAGTLIVDNLVGPWSALLFGVLVIVLTYLVTEEEQNKRLTELYRPYKKHWYDWIFRKCAVVMGVLLAVFLLNLLLSAIVLKIIVAMLESSEGFGGLYWLFTKKISLAFLFVIPALFFQLLLAVVIKKPIFPVVLGLLIMILGIPIANLTRLYLIPYSFTILSQNPANDLLTLGIVGIAISAVCALLTNRLLQRGRH